MHIKRNNRESSPYLQGLRPFGKSLPKNIGTVIVKHANPCGVSIHKDHQKSYQLALACDPISAFGGIVSCNYKINKNLAIELNKVFLEHLNEISKHGIDFINLANFKEIMNTKIDKNYLLLTIDDAFESFYLNAWPILKKKEIPFILFVSTREVGNRGYMTWEQIKEIEKGNLGTIGNHSHSHEYLIDWDKKKY